MSENDQEFSFKSLFIPLTTLKAIHIIVIVGLIVFFNALFNGFVWDDLAFIINNLDTHSINILHLFQVNVFNNSGYYRPLPAVYFTLLYTIFSTNAFFYHFFQVILHLVDVCLLFYLLQKFFYKTISLFLSLLFLVHPIQVESVSYIGASQSELFFLFGITALLISIRTVLNRRSLFFISILSLLALLTKETGFLFILCILFYQFIYQRRRLIKVLIFESVSIAIYCGIRFFIGGILFEKIDFVPIARLSLVNRLVTMPEVAFYYLKTIFYPAQLAVDQLWIIKNMDFLHFYLPLFFDSLFFSLLGLLAIYIYKMNRKSFRTFIFFSFWYLVGLLMLLQIFPLDMTVADRWFYFPFVGLLGIIGVMAQTIIYKSKSLRTISIAFMISILLVLSIRTIIRNQNWSTELTLYNHDVPLEDNFDNEYNYAAAFSHQGMWQEALEHSQKSVSLFPYETNLRGLGLVYAHLSNKKLTIEYYYKALQATSYVYKPHKHEEDTYANITKFEFLYGSPQVAKHIAKVGLTDYPSSTQLWLLLAVSEYKLKDQQEALKAAEKAYELSPNAQSDYVREQIRKNENISIRTGV